MSEGEADLAELGAAMRNNSDIDTIPGLIGAAQVAPITANREAAADLLGIDLDVEDANREEETDETDEDEAACDSPPCRTESPSSTNRRNPSYMVDVHKDDDADDTAIVQPSGRTFYPNTLQKRTWWINWVRAIARDEKVGEAKPTKQPVAPYNNGSAQPVKWNFGLSDAEHPSTSFDEVQPWEGKKIGLDVPAPDRVVTDRSQGGRQHVGTGIIIPPQQGDRKITLLDWDDVRDPETGEVHPVCAKALTAIGGFAEISQSGQGIHQFVFGEIPGSSKNFLRHVDDEPFVDDDLPMIEMYESGRVAAMTGRHVEGMGEDVVEAQDVIDGLVWRYGVGTNESTETPTDPFARKRDGADGDADRSGRRVGSHVPSHDEIDQAMREAAEYSGEDPSEWELPDGESTEYHALLRAREKSDEIPVENWRLIGLIAAAGFDCGLTEAEVLADLEAHPTPSYGFDERRAESEVRKTKRKYDDERMFAPSRKYLVQIGALPDGYDGAGPISAVPFDRLGDLDPEERRAEARQQGLQWPETSDAREDLEDTVVQALYHRENAVIEAPTSLGKSHTVATKPWLHFEDVTDERPVIHFHGTREARDQALAASQEADAVSAIRIQARDEACPVARGDFDTSTDGESKRSFKAPNDQPPSAWFARVCNNRGIPFSTAHKYLHEHVEGGLPCCQGDDDEPDGECPAISQWHSIPTDDDGNCHYDVIHATHEMSYVPSMRMQTNCIFDELPDFLEYTHTDDDAGESQGLSDKRIRTSVSKLLKAINAPITRWSDFLESALSTGATDASKEFSATLNRLEKDSNRPSRDWYFKQRGVHTIAPALAQAVAYALLTGDEDDRRYTAEVDYQPPRLDDDAHDSDGWNKEYVRVVLDEDLNVRRVRVRPDFSQSRSVVGMDAHPTMELWKLNFGAWDQHDHTDLTMGHVEIMEPDERKLWRRFERGLRVAQVGQKGRSYSGGFTNKDDKRRVQTFVETLRREYPDEFRTALTSKNVESDMIDFMSDSGIDEPEVIHYGAEKSRNDFSDERVGLVVGCIDAGDGFVYDTIAELGCDADAERRVRDVPCDLCGAEDEPKPHPETCDCHDGCDDCCSGCTCATCHGEGCDECEGTGLQRAWYRGFAGPNADVAQNINDSVREAHVAQAIGRYARDADDDENFATVFAMTTSVPDQLCDVEVPGVVKTYKPKQKLCVKALRDATTAGITASEIADQYEISKRHACRTLSELADWGVIDKQTSTDPTKGTIYTDGGKPIPEYALAVTKADPDVSVDG